MEGEKCGRAVLPGLDRANRLTGDSDQIRHSPWDKFFSALATRSGCSAGALPWSSTPYNRIIPEPERMSSKLGIMSQETIAGNEGASSYLIRKVLAVYADMSITGRLLVHR